VVPPASQLKQTPSAQPASAQTPLADAGPTQDFYAWVNRDWLASTVIPADKPAVNNFTVIDRQVTDQLVALLQDLTRLEHPSANERKLAALYTAYTDQARRNALGVRPLSPDLARADALKQHSGLPALWARWQKMGMATPLLFAVGTDYARADQQILFAAQGGLSLEREDYLGDDARTQTIRDQYQALLQKLFELAGQARAAEQARTVLALERGLARIQWSNTELRDPAKTYNLRTFQRLQASAPHLALGRQLAELGMPRSQRINVMQPAYVEALDRFVGSQGIDAWRAYLKAKLLLNHAKLLDDRFFAAITDYEIQRGLYAQPEPPERRAVRYLNENAGSLLGQAYVARHFDQRVKARLNGVIGRITDEYRLAVQTSPRMAPQTRAAALEKLDKLRFQIGAPQTWRDFRSLQVRTDSLIHNHQRLQEAEHRYNLAKLGKPVNPDDWGYPPQMVNAFYNPSSNTFVLLAGILHEPFFKVDGSDAELYGGIGFVIGHEIGHGFDDQGSQFDARGNLRNWWTPEDRAAYNQVRDALIAQADAYEVLPGHFLKGKLAIGEIMGDVSGAEIALRAYQKLARAQGLDPQQANREFFAQLARTWRSKSRPDFALLLLDMDPHPPGVFRANGVVKNFDAFHEAYQTRPGDKMYLPPAQRVRIWP
jgi:putative endopeptidase